MGGDAAYGRVGGGTWRGRLCGLELWGERHDCIGVAGRALQPILMVLSHPTDGTNTVSIWSKRY